MGGRRRRRSTATARIQTRLRLTAGMGALHKTLHHYADRDKACPNQHCNVNEDEKHLLLDCPLYVDPRRRLIASLQGPLQL